MLKKKVNLFLSLVLGIFATFLAKAQIYGTQPRGIGNFGNIEIVGSYISGDLIVWGSIFLILFAVLNFAVGRTPLGKNKGGAVVIALGLTTLSVYGLMRSGFNLGTLLGTVGFTDVGAYLPVVLGGFFLIFAVFLMVKRGLREGIADILWITGFFLMIASLTAFVYERFVVFVAGAVLFVIGLILLKIFKDIENKRQRGERIGFTKFLWPLLFIAGAILAIWFLFNFWNWLLWLGAIIIGFLLLLWLISKMSNMSGRTIKIIFIILLIIAGITGIFYALSQIPWDLIVILGVPLLLLLIWLLWPPKPPKKLPGPRGQKALPAPKKNKKRRMGKRQRKNIAYAAKEYGKKKANRVFNMGNGNKALPDPKKDERQRKALPSPGGNNPNSKKKNKEIKKDAKESLRRQGERKFSFWSGKNKPAKRGKKTPKKDNSVSPDKVDYKNESKGNVKGGKNIKLSQDKVRNVSKKGSLPAKGQTTAPKSKRKRAKIGRVTPKGKKHKGGYQAGRVKGQTKGNKGK